MIIVRLKLWVLSYGSFIFLSKTWGHDLQSTYALLPTNDKFWCWGSRFPPGSLSPNHHKRSNNSAPQQQQPPFPPLAPSLPWTGMVYTPTTCLCGVANGVATSHVTQHPRSAPVLPIPACAHRAFAPLRYQQFLHVHLRVCKAGLRLWVWDGRMLTEDARWHATWQHHDLGSGRGTWYVCTKLVQGEEGAFCVQLFEHLRFCLPWFGNNRDLPWETFS